VPMRGEIAGMIRKGMSRIEILDAFRHKYGEKILSAPTTQGFNLLAWIIPYVAVGAGMLLILIAVARWRKPDVAQTEPERQARVSAVSQFDPALRQQLERDLKRQL
jgi:cytochrome c-type biogenesis protein CcmH